jgi:diadenosine tetraphosphate (Ap4A) HIT family hydrolase
MGNSSAFTQLRSFITTKMRMAHIYQPLMIRTLVEAGGTASIRSIAAAFLARDESQLEYYEHITKVMPGRVLANHSVVRREGDSYRLLRDPQAMSAGERDEIVRLCDDALERFLARRGSAAYDHRRLGLGQVSGSARYEVLKHAGGRCELCGIPMKERAIEIDHVIPRKHGGTDDLENLQALCWKCNQNKGARDATDFRSMRQDRDHREAGCVFCAVDRSRVLAENTVAFALRDVFPVTRHHSLIVPRRHVIKYFTLYDPERRGIDKLLTQIREEILKKDRTVEGFNVGVNDGEAAGQTVSHCHVHLIPRRAGDVPNPRGGVRGVVPGRAAY